MRERMSSSLTVSPAALAGPLTLSKILLCFAEARMRARASVGSEPGASLFMSLHVAWNCGLRPRVANNKKSPSLFIGPRSVPDHCFHAFCTKSAGRPDEETWTLLLHDTAR